MNPNYTILIVLVVIPIFVFAVWKGGMHLANVVIHNIRILRREEEIRVLEAEQAEREVRLAIQLRELNAELAKQRDGQQVAQDGNEGANEGGNGERKSSSNDVVGQDAEATAAKIQGEDTGVLDPDVADQSRRGAGQERLETRMSLPQVLMEQKTQGEKHQQSHIAGIREGSMKTIGGRKGREDRKSDLRGMRYDSVLHQEADQRGTVREREKVKVNKRFAILVKGRQEVLSMRARLLLWAKVKIRKSKLQKMAPWGKKRRGKQGGMEGNMKLIDWAKQDAWHTAKYEQKNWHKKGNALQFKAFPWPSIKEDSQMTIDKMPAVLYEDEMQILKDVERYSLATLFLSIISFSFIISMILVILGANIYAIWTHRPSNHSQAPLDNPEHPSATLGGGDNGPPLEIPPPLLPASQQQQQPPRPQQQDIPGGYAEGGSDADGVPIPRPVRPPTPIQIPPPTQPAITSGEPGLGSGRVRFLVNAIEELQRRPDRSSSMLHSILREHHILIAERNLREQERQRTLNEAGTEQTHDDAIDEALPASLGAASVRRSPSGLSRSQGRRSSSDYEAVLDLLRVYEESAPGSADRPHSPCSPPDGHTFDQRDEVDASSSRQYSPVAQLVQWLGQLDISDSKSVSGHFEEKGAASPTKQPVIPGRQVTSQ
ncbi:hypothetical protein PRK78_002468 [Emydomyces testavorans]|uniref:Uncharacterized protein n=1 Tax=Emydomyces testavorans TaxID=2070801 RepID=A0AAF0DED1_9EURO|nr:hypothetical protein PRK78_002468 [Emydomyces testavorans]